MRYFLLIIVVALLSACILSCGRKMQGVYRVIYQEKMDNDYDVFLLRHENTFRFYVTYRKEVICEMDVYPREIHAVVFPYLSKYGAPDSHTVRYGSTGKLTTARWITSETNTVVLFDTDGDGLPDKRVTHNQDAFVTERLETTATVLTSRQRGGVSRQATNAVITSEQE